MSSNTKRPTGIPYPNIWSQFQRDGRTFVIRDLTEDMTDEAVNILTEHFVNDEPPCRFSGLRNHPESLQHLVELWRKTLADKLSLVCTTDDGLDGPSIVAVNALTIAEKGEDEPFQTDDKLWNMLFGAVELVAKSVDLFNTYNTDRYLNAYGLVVVPKYRGLNVGTEMLRARIPLCKALGLSITATVFTALPSQRCAEKAGFQTLAEISYQDMAKNHGFVFPDIEKHTRSSKLMVLEV